MEREYSSDQVDEGIGQFLSLSAAALAAACEWILEADRGQLFLADGSPNLVQWVSARFGLRHSTAAQLVRVARRLQDLPVLRERFAAGELSLDQVDAISKLATPDTEEAVIAACLGLSNPALDRAARRADPPSSQDELESWRDRWLSIQYTLDGIRGSLHADLPGPDLSSGRIGDPGESGSDSGESRIRDFRSVSATTRRRVGRTLATTTGDENTSSPTQIIVHADLGCIDRGSGHHRGGRDRGWSGDSQ